MVTFAAFAYISAIPVSIVSYLRQKSAWEKRIANGEEDAAAETDPADLLDADETLVGDDKA